MWPFLLSSEKVFFEFDFLRKIWFRSSRLWLPQRASGKISRPILDIFQYNLLVWRNQWFWSLPTPLQKRLNFVFVFKFSVWHSKILINFLVFTLTIGITERFVNLLWRKITIETYFFWISPMIFKWYIWVFNIAQFQVFQFFNHFCTISFFFHFRNKLGVVFSFPDFDEFWVNPNLWLEIDVAFFPFAPLFVILFVFLVIRLELQNRILAL